MTLDAVLTLAAAFLVLCAAALLWGIAWPRIWWRCVWPREWARVQRQLARARMYDAERASRNARQAQDEAAWCERMARLDWLADREDAR